MKNFNVAQMAKEKARRKLVSFTWGETKKHKYKHMSSTLGAWNDVFMILRLKRIAG